MNNDKNIFNFILCIISQVTESDRNKEINNQSNTSDGSEKYIVSEKRKPSSPLSPTLPNKVSKE